CRELQTDFLDDESQANNGPVGGSTGGGDALPDSVCDVQPTSDIAIVIAARELNQLGTPESVTVDDLTFDQALDRMREVIGPPAIATGNDARGSDPVWLVTFSGNIIDAPSPIFIGTPSPL